jgi:hypothetical protein
MPENEFEHRVQQKMEEFNLRPSDLVWTEVERRIRKEKRRRFIFWWFLLAGLLAGGIGTTIWLGNKNKTEQNKITAQKKSGTNNSNTSITAMDDKENKPVEKINAEKGRQQDTVETTAVQQSSIPANAVNNNSTSGNSSQIATSRKIIKRPGIQNNVPGEIEFRQQNGVKKKKQKNPVKKEEPPVVEDNAHKKDAEEKTTAQHKVAEPVMVTDIASVKTTVAPAVPEPEKIPGNTVKDKKTDTVVTSTAGIKIKKKAKGEWELGFSLGRSSSTAGFGLFAANAYADAAGGGGIGVGATPPPSPSSPSVIRPGLSAGISLYKRKIISPRLQLALGLGYDYYSTHMKVGAKVDSVRNVFNNLSSGVAVNNFYRPSGSPVQSNYTNRYHFINLSAALNWKIINGKKFSMYWRNELQYQVLAGSNMLHYDYSIPGYYKDNSLLRKGNIFLQTGLSFPAGKRLQFNPYITYGITPVLKNSSSRTHYSNTGLRLIFSLQKK